MLPGLQAQPFVGGNTLIIDSVRTDVDLWVELGSPAYAVSLLLYITPTGVISATTPTVPALRMDTMTVGSSVTIFLEGGEVRGAGGGGGWGQWWNPLDLASGSGGGGGGTIVGPGGTGFPGVPVTDGADGTDETGGAGGLASPAVMASGRSAGPGQAGSDAIVAGDIPLTLKPTSGLIWGGGGGGGGGGGNGTEPGANGGAVGADGGFGGGGGGQPGGAGGYAVRGTAITQLAGSADIRGTVGPT